MGMVFFFALAAKEVFEATLPGGHSRPHGLTDLTGWQLVLYNGTGGVAYSTTALTGVIRELAVSEGWRRLPEDAWLPGAEAGWAPGTPSV